METMEKEVMEMGELVKRFKFGACEASVFENEIDTRDGRRVKLRNAVLQKRYKDRNGEWASTNSFDVNDIPKALLALNDAYRFIVVDDNTEESRD
jgi:hypothetical protein